MGKVRGCSGLKYDRFTIARIENDIAIFKKIVESEDLLNPAYPLTMYLGNGVYDGTGQLNVVIKNTKEHPLLFNDGSEFGGLGAWAD